MFQYHIERLFLWRFKFLRSSMGKYKKYHSDVKSTYALGLQNELLPNEFKKDIPNSTASYWKENEKPERYVGGELASGIQSNLNDTKVFLDPRIHLGKDIFMQVARFYIAILNLIGKERVFTSIVNNKGIIVQLLALDLIVDGGSENNNKTVANFIKSCEVSIQKKIALKDVTFSNSIVEGPYKIMKSYYFRRKEIYASTLKDELEFFVFDYNYNKPCHKHRYFTPHEVHLEPDILERKPIIPNCNQARLDANRNYCCKLLVG